jgi:hypothetical protein
VALSNGYNGTAKKKYNAEGNGGNKGEGEEIMGNVQ